MIYQLELELECHGERGRIATEDRRASACHVEHLSLVDSALHPSVYT